MNTIKTEINVEATLEQFKIITSDYITVMHHVEEGYVRFTIETEAGLCLGFDIDNLDVVVID